MWFLCSGLTNDKANETCGIYHKKEMDGDTYEIWLVMPDNWHHFSWSNRISMGQCIIIIGKKNHLNGEFENSLWKEGMKMNMVSHEYTEILHFFIF